MITGPEAKPPIPLKWLLIPWGFFAAGAVIADWFWPTLITHHPLSLLVLSSKNRYLLLTAPQVGGMAFFTVAFLRLVAADPLTFLLGRYYGATAIDWVEARTSAKPKGQSILRKAERLFDRASPLVIFIAPSVLWNVLAGASGMKVWVYVTCNLTGTVARLVLFWYAADAFRDELESALDAIEGVQIPLLVATVGLGALQIRRNRHRLTTTPREALFDLEGSEGLVILEDLAEEQTPG